MADGYPLVIEGEIRHAREGPHGLAGRDNGIWKGDVRGSAPIALRGRKRPRRERPEDQEMR
jgi:hypothetical protein